MRALHVSKQPELLKPVIEAFQTFLRTSTIGPRFFASVARRETVSKILKEAYYDPTTVTDELVDVILKPGFTENASKVFLDFISYSGGPLPEDLLPKVAIENKTPCLMLWGEKDPWEKMDDGRKLYEKYANAGFVVLKDAGHCPMDENPALVNPLMSKFIEEYA
jgi:pimeloyl-ACP methyl ester carboxylesterase